MSITLEEYHEFFAATIPQLGTILPASPRINWSNQDDDVVLILSFDRDWKPFLGETQGLNPKEKRHYITSGIFIEKLIPILKMQQAEIEERIPGGRFFFGHTTIWKKDINMEKHIAIEFSASPETV